MQETRAGSLGWEDPLEKEMDTHSSTLAWRISWTGSLAGYSPWGHKELNLNMHTHTHTHTHTHIITAAAAAKYAGFVKKFKIPYVD